MIDEYYLYLILIVQGTLHILFYVCVSFSDYLFSHVVVVMDSKELYLATSYLVVESSVTCLIYLYRSYIHDTWK